MQVQETSFSTTWELTVQACGKGSIADLKANRYLSGRQKGLSIIKPLEKKHNMREAGYELHNFEKLVLLRTSFRFYKGQFPPQRNSLFN
jgi:hypothetical protein